MATTIGGLVKTHIGNVVFRRQLVPGCCQMSAPGCGQTRICPWEKSRVASAFSNFEHLLGVKMDARGHPKRPLERKGLPLDSLVESFLKETEEESPSLAKYLKALVPHGRNELGGVLGRFDFQHRGHLNAEERLLARRVLGRLHRPSSAGLVLTNQILDYLDLNHNALLEPKEIEFCIEILEMFARADSDNDTVSEYELELLYAVLRDTDTNDNRVLDAHEKELLHEALESPKAFLQRQRVSNPRFAELITKRQAH